jgi:ubiquinone/menaquinone biosynthesis C-methylase UbiE
MIEMAAFLSNHLSIVRPLFKRSTKQAKGMVCPTATSFSKANAENTDLPSRSFDLVTIMYAFHEAPKQGREQILKEAHRLLQPGGTLAVVDICSDYKASESMLAGEPYGTFYMYKVK